MQMERLTGRNKGFGYSLKADALPKEKQAIDGGREVLMAIMEIMTRLADHEDAATPKPLEEWHEDLGNVLWWTFPIQEPPYCGSPLADDWPGCHTHWTSIIVPILKNTD